MGPAVVDIDGLHRRAQVHVGIEMPPFLFRVEAAKVVEFRRALRRTDNAGGVPITFYEAVRLQQPPDSDVLAPLGLAVSALLHGEQEIDVHRPLQVGDELVTTSMLESVDRRRGRRGGDMLSLSIRTAFATPGGRLRLEARRRVLQLAAQPNAAGPPPPAENGWEGHVDLEALTLSDIVQYAGASGDFNPSHYDRDLARAAGNPDVFAHGMFGAGLVMEAVREHFSGRAISVRIRFLDRIWPGRALAVMWRPQEDGRRYRLVDDRGGKVDVAVRPTAVAQPSHLDR